MEAQEKYDAAFVESLGVTVDELAGLAYQAVPGWDSVGHMALVASLEEAFGIILEMDDILDLSSYEVGKGILAKYEVSLTR
jgi:acyl carrier protein